MSLIMTHSKSYVVNKTKGVDGTHYLPRGSALDDRMRGVREGPGKPPPDKEEPSAKASSRARLEKTLEGPPPYRQVVLAPLSKDYWDETPAEGGGGELDCTTTTTTSTTTTSSSSNHSINNNSVSINNNNLNNNNNNNSNKFETDESATYYRRFFLGKEHWNFYGVDAVQGPVLVSQRREVVGSQELVHLLVRLGDGLHHASLPAAGQDLRPAALVKRVKELAVERFSPVVSPVAPQLIVAYDEHALKHQFKFGLIVQRFGQTVEEQLFANKGMSPALEQFLSLMGRRVKLREHEGFKGGLDTQFGQTGEESVYEVFREKEVMFHVSTLLPYKEQDPQQLERKRHIGNDMVAVVFQEENTPFAPDMVASHFLHAYVVVMPIDPCTPNTRYKVSVTARRDVPFFGPTLPSSATFSHGPQFKEFLLTKLINAEMACYKASQFAKLEARTRSSLLAALVDDLRAKTNEFLGQAEVPETPKVETTSNRFKEIVAGLIGRSRSQDATNTQSVKKSGVTATPSTLLATTPLSVRSKGSGGSSEARTPPSSPDTTPNTHLALSESDDSSLNSDIDNHPHPLNEDSDTGLESMSSAETPHNVAVACPLCGGQEEGAGGFHANPEAVLRQVEALNQEINKLKCDKLDLLRQNVTCQRDIKKLKEKELKVGSELMAATKEITRLQGLLSEFGTGQVSTV
ncbi:rap1 GTPase-activating protein 1-like isoform X4 [Eriocheir sinensis]|uniref:rap1 GTPase-activating protein 1-like isoform X4 n=1 Tax=Eriocheir sinensis TaxID=95602 RepID=UPI0021C7C1E8|nr:rap1 GTPase-activating protein 1-like isoform X4 [Eriocheir sinensis]